MDANEFIVKVNWILIEQSLLLENDLLFCPSLSLPATGGKKEEKNNINISNFGKARQINTNLEYRLL